MNNKTKASRLSNFIAIMIAIVSIVGATIAWRVAIAASAAGNADTAGLLAELDQQDAESFATITVFGHLTAYASFVSDRALANVYDQLAAANPQRADYAAAASAFRLASNYALGILPAAYVDRNEKLNVARDRGETIARESIDKNIDPKPNFDNADKDRLKVQLLLVNLILLGVALVCLTLADAIRNLLRYLFLFAGIGAFAIGALGALIIELIFPYVVL